MPTSPPLLLLHGLWDTPRLFRRLEQELRQRNPELELDAPHLPHRLGAVPIRTLASNLAERIEQRFGPDRCLDLLGFSMGGVIARVWLQEHDGHRRTRRFVCVGSPQNGTLAAQLAPPWLAGIADMKIGSQLLRELDMGRALLQTVQCRSFYTPSDLTVLPGWRAVLPFGMHEAIPVLTHRQLISDPRAIRRLADVLLAPSWS